MNRAHARINHPTARPSFAEAFADVRDAYSDLEHAFESHDSGATSEAARVWWESLQRLRAAS